MTHFKFLTGDVNWSDYGGKWYREVSPRVYHVRELLNWEDACGTSEAKEIGFTYNCSLSVVDLNDIPPNQLQCALDSCGINRDECDAWKTAGAWDLVCVEACHGYGAYAPIWQENGNNYRKLFKEANAQSRDLEDEHNFQEAMDMPVNAIMTSARNYMRGEFFNF